jgi:hypothetical protein
MLAQPSPTGGYCEHRVHYSTGLATPERINQPSPITVPGNPATYSLIRENPMSSTHLSYLYLSNLDSPETDNDSFMFELPLENDPTLDDDAELSINAYYRAIGRS